MSMVIGAEEAPTVVGTGYTVNLTAKLRYIRGIGAAIGISLKNRNICYRTRKATRVISSAFKNAQLNFSAIWNYQPAIPMMDQTSVFYKESKFLVVQGPEPLSLAIIVRESLVPAIRLLWYHRSFDGPYKSKGKVLYARSRMMFARAKMKHYKLRGRGAKDLDEITICNVHLH